MSETGAERYLRERTSPYIEGLMKAVHAAYCGCGASGGPEDRKFVMERLADLRVRVEPVVVHNSRAVDGGA